MKRPEYPAAGFMEILRSPGSAATLSGPPAGSDLTRPEESKAGGRPLIVGARVAAGLAELFLKNPELFLDVAEEERAVLLAPQALGQIASRGEPAALDALLEMTADEPGDGALRRAASGARHPDAFRHDLLKMALRGLAYAGQPVAESRLLVSGAGKIDRNRAYADVGSREDPLPGLRLRMSESDRRGPRCLKIPRLSSDMQAGWLVLLPA